MTTKKSDEIEFLSIRDLANGLDQGIFTSSELVKFFSEKISLEDGDFNSIAFPNPQAEDIAKRMDEERKTTARYRTLSVLEPLLPGNLWIPVHPFETPRVFGDCLD